MITFPYGIADFARIRRQRMVYVDRTSHIRDLEEMGSIIVFLRPRRFGKSLWLQTLAEYYDLRKGDQFDELFGGLAIGRDPTPLRNSYFVMQWNLSKVDAGGSVDQIREGIRIHVSAQAKLFARQYQDLLPFPIEVDGTPVEVLGSLLGAVSETDSKLYLLIDEYGPSRRPGRRWRAIARRWSNASARRR